MPQFVLNSRCFSHTLTLSDVGSADKSTATKIIILHHLSIGRLTFSASKERKCDICAVHYNWNDLMGKIENAVYLERRTGRVFGPLSRV